MPEPGARTPAGYGTALDNLQRIQQESNGQGPIDPADAIKTTRDLRDELIQKGLRGFKKGGKVKKTGPAILHKGEQVLTANQAASRNASQPSPNRPSRLANSTGGLALDPSAKGAKISGYEPRHSSKHR